MPTPRRALGLMPSQMPAAPTPPADSTPFPLSATAAPSRNHGPQTQQLLSPVFGLLRAATASPVAAAAAAAAAVHALTSAAATATSPCMLPAGGSGGPTAPSASHSSSSTSSSRQRLRTFSTTSCAPSPLMGLADDLVQALLHAGASSAPKHSHLLGARSRTASLDHLGAIRSSAIALSDISTDRLGSNGASAHSILPDARTNSLPTLVPPPTVSSPHMPLPFMASPPARVAAPAPPSLLSSWSHEHQQQQPVPQRQLPTPTFQISLAPPQQPQLPAAPSMPLFSTRPTRSAFPTFGGQRRANNKSLARITAPLYNNKVGDEDTLNLPAKPLGLLARSTPSTYPHSPTCLSSSSSDLLDLGYLADSEHDPAASHHFDHSPPFTPHSLLFAHTSAAQNQVAPPLPPFASRAPAPTLILPPPIPIPSSSVHNPSPSTYPPMPSPHTAAPSLLCPQPTRSTSTFQFAVVPAYDPALVTCAPDDAGAASASSLSFGPDAFPVIPRTPLDVLKTPPRTFVMHPPSPISRPGGGGGGGGAPTMPSTTTPSPMVPRLVAPRPVRALPASAAVVGIKNVLANGLPPRTSPVSPMVACAGMPVVVVDVGKLGG
ncbi:hypothetical protein BCR44DRAFT_36598 [Catenaria anguillulae PL171]|uniref:Uncharacterized protein n=1 Tax=Catenaria anguillulae PL171 TaxID=765915 RepID=A0A1Y2I440_9FUNG|nr:hypothetical protein BCR44DRAFT_36598 [Catenaria anguillulae PL171]